MSEEIWIADLTIEQLRVWLKPPRTEAPFAILERIDAIDFPSPEEVIAPEDWSQGRIFGPLQELRWERQGELFRARLTGERDSGAPFGLWPGLAGTGMSRTGCYLWGRHEMRIGRRLEYRAIEQGEGRPRLLRHEFRRPDGSLAAERLAGMEWEAGP